tara:strand:- start:1043 stop:1624 length:582 start_codon:yes stop_codon:yes gene_type:complete
MKKIFFIIFFLIFSSASLNSEIKINPISEGSPDAKIHLIVYESLTCSHCANFHKNIYPDLKKDFIDKGLVKIEFRNFPLDMLALNAAKIAHCKNDGKSKILHSLYKDQKKWVTGETIGEANNNIKKIIENNGFDLDFNKCLNSMEIEDHILEDRVEGVKKFKIEATPTLIINNKKFDKALNYKNIKKFLEKLI